MPTTLTNCQVDQLGERLRQGRITERDLVLLNDYRQSFGDAYDVVIRAIRDRLQLEPTGRPAKSTPSIVAKLLRETARLSQVQDIAGCRVILDDVTQQNRAVESILELFPNARVIDRRSKPSHGYRAVHIIVDRSGKLVEIQVRTYLQHRWAELSEKMSDVRDPRIKYGGGDMFSRLVLWAASGNVQWLEGQKIKGVLARILQPIINFAFTALLASLNR